MRHNRIAGLLTGLALLAAPPVAAQTTPAAGTPPATSVPPPQPVQASAAKGGIWQRSNLLGEMGGLRPALERYGISLGISETSEVLGNVTGGVRQGAAYDGLTTMSLRLDTAKAFGWSGGSAYISALQIHGRNLSTDNLDTLQTASGIAAERATRLWELWFDQAFLGGRLDVKLGQQSIDQEFIVSQYSALFLNAAMGWPALPGIDMYSAGPSYPLSSLGVRLQVKANDAITLLGGVFGDNPPGGPFNDNSQLRGREAAGAAFNLNTGALWIGEVQYAVHQSPADSCGSLGCGLPGTYKLGMWYDSGGFPDQRFGDDGLSLASPASSGNPLLHHGNFSFYALADQMVWRQPRGARSVGVFVRAMGAPPNQNLVDWSLDAGVTVKAPLPGRDGDTFGIGYGVAHVSPRAAALDRDTALFGGSPYPVRGAEQFIELTYQLQAAPWWIVQPDLQYVLNPGGGIPDPSHPGHRVGNELVLGLRTAITF